MRSGKVVLAFSYSLGVLRRLFLGVCHGKVFGKADLLRLVAANGGQYTRRGRGRLQSTVRTEQIRCREEMATDAQVLSRGGNGSPRIQVTGEICHGRQPKNTEQTSSNYKAIAYSHHSVIEQLYRLHALPIHGSVDGALRYCLGTCIHIIKACKGAAPPTKILARQWILVT
jgi:hypothetical protein